jgi:phosphatidylcholine synthase
MIFRAIAESRYLGALVWTLVSIIVDATDGTLARALNVKLHAPIIDGTQINVIVDFVNVTFLPLTLMLHAGWLPYPGWLWVSIAAVASLINFCFTYPRGHSFHRGVPVIYSMCALYTFLLIDLIWPNLLAAILITGAVLELMPIFCSNPHDAFMFKRLFIIGGFAWIGSMAVILWLYPDVPRWLIIISAAYPIAYVPLAIVSEMKRRTTSAAVAPE